MPKIKTDEHSDWREKQLDIQKMARENWKFNLFQVMKFFLT